MHRELFKIVIFYETSLKLHRNRLDPEIKQKCLEVARFFESPFQTSRQTNYAVMGSGEIA
jgi:hypothetical protein